MDEQFIPRVLRASVVMTALIGLCGLAYPGPLWSFAFVLAGLWSTANLWALEHLLMLLFRKGNRLALVAFFCLKIPILYGLILGYLLWVPWRPSALIGGVTLPYAVIVLKALGRSLVDAMGRKDASPTTEAESEQQDKAQ
jgi:hypothetical protein